MLAASSSQAEQKLAETKQSTDLAMHQLNAQMAQYEVSMDEARAVDVSERKVRVENARGEFEVAVTKAKGEIEVAEFNGRAEKEKLVSTTKIQSERRLREAQAAGRAL